MRYRFFRSMTLAWLLFAILGVRTLTRAWPPHSPNTAVLAFGLVLPLLFGAALFVYKSYVGIKKPWIALSYWAAWASYASLFYANYLAVHAPAHMLIYLAVVFVVLLTSILFALGQHRHWLPFAVCGVAYSSQNLLLWCVLEQAR